jgi:hypothetical protein
MGLKEKLHHLIDSCNDEEILQDTVQLLEQSLDKSDWWNLLSNEQKNTTLKAIEESENNQTISHQSIQQKIWSKFGK